jgi:phage repressor protein C with HTH and peptisase S24 domain
MQENNEGFLRAVDSLSKVHGLKHKDIAAAIGIRPTYFSQLVNGRAPSVKIVKSVELLLFQKDSQNKTSSRSNVVSFPAGPPPRRVPVVAWAIASAYLDHYGGNFSDLANQIDETVDTDSKDPNAYALIIEGDSMEPRFCAGDRIITAPNYEPRNGDFVVARLRETGQVLFKRFRRIGPEGKMIRLESLNPAYGPVEYPESAFRLIHPVVEAKMNLKR